MAHIGHGHAHAIVLQALLESGEQGILRIAGPLRTGAQQAAVTALTSDSCSVPLPAFAAIGAQAPADATTADLIAAVETLTARNVKALAKGKQPSASL